MVLCRDTIRSADWGEVPEYWLPSFYCYVGCKQFKCVKKYGLGSVFILLLCVLYCFVP